LEKPPPGYPSAHLPARFGYVALTDNAAISPPIDMPGSYAAATMSQSADSNPLSFSLLVAKINPRHRS
jgi:hypothetical protein